MVCYLTAFAHFYLGRRVHLRYVKLKKGTYAKLRPVQFAAFSLVTNQKALLETLLRHFATLVKVTNTLSNVSVCMCCVFLVRKLILPLSGGLFIFIHIVHSWRVCVSIFLWVTVRGWCTRAHMPRTVILKLQCIVWFRFDFFYNILRATNHHLRLFELCAVLCICTHKREQTTT